MKEDIAKRVNLDQSVNNIISIVENAVKNYEKLTLSDAYKLREFLKMTERFVELSIDVMEFEARNNAHDLYKQAYYERLREELNEYDRKCEQTQEKEEKE